MTALRTRRRFFKFGALGALGTLLLGLAGQRAGAAPTLSKAAVGYQDVPSGDGKVCAQCVYYVPIAAGAALGGCKLVAGGIAPGGWCELWSPKG